MQLHSPTIKAISTKMLDQSSTALIKCRIIHCISRDYTFAYFESLLLLLSCQASSFTLRLEMVTTCSMHRHRDGNCDDFKAKFVSLRIDAHELVYDILFWPTPTYVRLHVPALAG